MQRWSPGPAVAAAERTRLAAGESARPLPTLAAELVAELGGYVDGVATAAINARA